MALPQQGPPVPPFRVEPRPNVFLGFDEEQGNQRCWSAPEDSVGIVGPPRYGKSSGLVIPSVFWWGGPVVSTSTRGDVLRDTGDWRRSIARHHGGELYVYDPMGSEYPGRSMRWSPLADCADPSVCYRRVAAMTAVSGQGMQDGDHWRSGAAMILRAYFHAAALEGLPLQVVRRWLARQDVRDAVAILRMSDSPAAMWGDDLESTRLLGDRERGSFFSTARTTLEATAEPKALASCAATDLDLDRFLTTNSSLFIIGPSHHQAALAPLIAGLVDSIAQRAAEVAALQGGRLRSPLLLALDEVANIAPLQSLPQLVSEGGGRGIVTMWATQSLAQLRARYGEEEQTAILAATTAKLIFGGMSSSRDLHNISAWAGERRFSDVSRSMAETPAGQRPSSTTVGSRYDAALPVEAIQMLPPLNAWLFYRSDPPVRVKTWPAGTLPAYQQIRGFTP